MRLLSYGPRHPWSDLLPRLLENIVHNGRESQADRTMGCAAALAVCSARVNGEGMKLANSCLPWHDKPSSCRAAHTPHNLAGHLPSHNCGDGSSNGQWSFPTPQNNFVPRVNGSKASAHADCGLDNPVS